MLSNPVSKANQEYKRIASERMRRQEMRQQPTRYAGGGSAPTYWVISQIESDDELYSQDSFTVTGCDYISGTTPTEVPSDDPQNFDGTYPANIMRGFNETTDEWCWVVLRAEDTGGQQHVGLQHDVANDVTLVSNQKITLYVAGTDEEETMEAYVAWKV